MRRVRIDRSAGRMRAFRIAYDGSQFRGFQRQPDVKTVEDTLFDALRTLGVFDRDREAAASDSDGRNSSTTPGAPATGDSPETADGDAVTGPNRPPGYAAAGRTDAGVSALAQTVAFACPTWLTPRALNSELPASIRAWASADVAPDFHATHDAVRREYTYYLHAPAKNDVGAGGTEAKTPHLPRIDDERVRAALAMLSGRHDFHNLASQEEGTVRDLTATVARDGEFLLLRVAADGFPRGFVRRLATLLREVGTGTAEPAFVERILGSEPLSGAEGVGPAPAEPLVLSGVTYPNCEFERDSDAATSAAAVFSTRQSAALSTARVAGFVCEGVSGDATGAAQL